MVHTPTGGFLDELTPRALQSSRRRLRVEGFRSVLFRLEARKVAAKERSLDPVKGYHGHVALRDLSFVFR